MGKSFATTPKDQCPVRRYASPCERDIMPDPRAPLADLSPAAVMALQRAAGNAAVGNHLAEQSIAAPAVMQRSKVRTGRDPLQDLAQPGARGLLYGTSTTRKETSKRLMAQDQKLGLNAHRTIDAYNDAAGINDAMSNAAIGIFHVRDALKNLDASNPDWSAWSSRLQKADSNLAHDGDLQAWIICLKGREQWIGLYDLGSDAAGGQKRTEGARFGKNLRDKAHSKATRLTPTDISWWLRADRSIQDAENNFDALFPPPSSADVKKWIYSAFFRRTSKLGIDFTTGRQQTVHFNISADPKWDPSKGGAPKLKRGGMKSLKQNYGRLITSSEYRHLKKGIKQGTIDRAFVNFYDEY